MVFLGGHPAKYWPPSLVCVVRVCVCMFVLLCQVFDVVAHLRDHAFISPVFAVDFTSHSRFMQCHTDTPLCWRPAMSHRKFNNSSLNEQLCVLLAGHSTDLKNMLA